MTVVAYCENSVQCMPPDGSLLFTLYKIQFQLGLCPGPHWESLQHSPEPLSFSDDFDTSLSNLGAFGTEVPQLLNYGCTPAYPHVSSRIYIR